MSRRYFVVPSLLWASCSAARLRLRSLIFYFHPVWSAISQIKHILTPNPSLFWQWRGVGWVGRYNINWFRGCLFYTQTSKPNSSGRVISRRMAMQALVQRFRFQQGVCRQSFFSSSSTEWNCFSYMYEMPSIKLSTKKNGLHQPRKSHVQDLFF